MDSNNEIFESLKEFELLKEEDKLLRKESIKALRSVVYIPKSKPPKDEEELYDAYINTLQRHDLKDSFPSQLLSPFYKLSKYDNINQHKNDKYFIKLDQLLKYLKLHQDILKEYKNTPKNSTINTSYSNTKNYVIPQIKNKQSFINDFKANYADDDLENDKTFQSVQKTAKILNLYKDEPLIGSLLIQASKNKEFNFLTEGYTKELQQINERIFSYKLKLSKRDIVKSFQCYAIDIYHELSVQNQLMKNPKKKIENKMLVNLIGEISKHLLDEKVGKLHVKNINSRFYYIDIINNMMILQPSTTKVSRFNFNISNNSLDDFLSQLLNDFFDDVLLKLDKSIMDLEK